MRRNENVRAIDHHSVFDNPVRYNFLDISQNNAWSGLGQGHYDNIMYVRNYIAENPRPINNIKNYGAVRHGEDESLARFAVSFLQVVQVPVSTGLIRMSHPIHMKLHPIMDLGSAQ
jgi:hypothetical protein